MLALHKASTLRGEVTIPGDKSISHRAIMFGSLAKGDSVVTNFLDGADCLSTIDCFTKLGVFIERDWDDPHRVVVHGTGLHNLHPSFSTTALYTGNSGTTTRIISGILAAQRFTTLLSGDESINKRPMKRVMDPLTQMGADIISMNDDGCAPLRITGAPLHGITYVSPVASAQVKSAILCAGLYADCDTTVIEPAQSRDHTERMLRAFGAKVDTMDLSDDPRGTYSATIHPAEELYASDIVVPGDISSAAYFIAAGLLVPGAEILIKNVGTNPTRDGMLRVARAMGGSVELLNPSDSAEPYADLLVKASSLHGITIEGDIIPTLIDELPVIAVMAACAEGTTIIKDAAELKVKESNRIDTVTEGLRAMGVDVTPTEDGMIIKGTGALKGAPIKTYKDHRIAMSFAVASLVADGETTLDDETCVDISYPTFFEDLKKLQ